MLRRRQKKYRALLRESIMSTLLDKQTYYVFYSIRKGLGIPYARAMIRDSMYDLVLQTYKGKGLEMAFYTDIAYDLCQWCERIMVLGRYDVTAYREKFVFYHEQGIQARRLYFQFGDHIHNRLVDYPAAQMEMSNIMFDVIDRKGVPGQEPLIFASPNRSISFFELREEEPQDSMKD